MMMDEQYFEYTVMDDKFYIVRILLQSKYVPLNYCCNYKGKMFSEWIWWTITSWSQLTPAVTGEPGRVYLLVGTLRTHYLGHFPAKETLSELNGEKTRNINLLEISSNRWSILISNHEKQRKNDEPFGTGDWKDLTAKCSSLSWIGSWARKKECYADYWGNLNVDYKILGFCCIS